LQLKFSGGVNMEKRNETEQEEIRRLKQEIKDKSGHQYKVGDYVDYDSHMNGKGRGRILDVIETREGQKLIVEPNRKKSERGGEILVDIEATEVEKVLRKGNIQKITYR